nr:hypothetical protein [Kofleriaceae bacterium]
MRAMLQLLALVGFATAASAACDPHPYEHFTIYDVASGSGATGLLGESCDVRAGDGDTATLSCGGRVYQLVRERS